MNNPLAPDAPLCKNLEPVPEPNVKWTAGQSISVSFYGTARHLGGHCQFSMSYDGGKTFVVVHEILRYCLYESMNGNTVGKEATGYTFNLPNDLPSSNTALFAWTWVNAVGNREFYMNCADVIISGTSDSYTGKQMTIANHNGYDTIPEFGGNYDTGVDIYESAPLIKVTGDGQTTKVSGGGGGSSNGNGSGYGGSSSSSSSSSSSGTTSQTVGPDNTTATPFIGAQRVAPINGASSTSSTPIDSTSAIPPASTVARSNNTNADLADSGNGPCTLGKMRCVADTSIFDTCDHSGWISRPCAPGTSCKMTAGGGSPCI
ncbi:hypothetical protein H4R99_006261 [Coemansia sp. RSA 1722]|nr:hypothetical protein H4R99_006261 [Coemansia sp. RSA 1722]